MCRNFTLFCRLSLQVGKLSKNKKKKLKRKAKRQQRLLEERLEDIQVLQYNCSTDRKESLRGFMMEDVTSTAAENSAF